MGFAEINGKEVGNLQEGFEMLRELWAEYKAPMVAEQKEAGGAKVTDPAPPGEDEGEDLEGGEGEGQGQNRDLPKLSES